MESEESGEIKLMRKARVVQGHRSNYPEPLKLKVGEVLTLEDREAEYSGWLWCIDSSGKSGWVPENYVEVLGPSIKMKRDYDATELSIKEGAEVTVYCEESGWVWCKTGDGKHGWLPLKNVELG
jgi:uncharacterized protein YgiM (DUF1202 family)